MKHIRKLEVDQPLDGVLAKRVAHKTYLSEERGAGPRFFRGLIIALAFSMPSYAALFYVLF